MVDRLLKIRTGRQPHELLVLLATVILGTVGTFLPEKISTAIAETFARPISSVYWAGLALFAGIALFGIIRRRVDGLLIERAALVVLTALYGAYVVAVISSSGLAGFAACALPLAFAIANVCRVFQIRRDLQLLASYLKDHPGEQVR